MMTFLNNHFGKVVEFAGAIREPPGPISTTRLGPEQSGLALLERPIRQRAVLDPDRRGDRDEQIPENKGGTFSIIVSKPEDRPKSATQACGHAWLDWGRRGDFTGRDGQTTLSCGATRCRPTASSGSTSRSASRERKRRSWASICRPVRYFADAAEFDAEVGCLNGGK